MSSENLVAGSVHGARVLLIDDLVASGGTLVGAARALRTAGAAEVLAFAAHGLFTGPAARQLDDNVLGQLVVCDSVPPFRLPAGAALGGRMRVVAAAPLFSLAVRESHDAWRRG